MHVWSTLGELSKILRLNSTVAVIEQYCLVYIGLMVCKRDQKFEEKLFHDLVLTNCYDKS